MNNEQMDVLKVLISGGGPVGLSFALLLEGLMGKRVAIKIYEGRWTDAESKIVWKDVNQGNARRQQVVTLQSRQFLKLPQSVQDRIFQDGHYTEMWPEGPDSIDGYGPRNVRIAHIENQLLEIANEKSESIELIPQRFKAEEMESEIREHHLFAICEGGRSPSRDYFIDKFGEPNKSMYSLDGEHVQDVVLGLRVHSDLPDPMAVLLTVAQNRFLLNSLNGRGFLNMRLTDEEVREVVGLDIENYELKSCIQSQPCVMERADGDGVFQCATHGSLFLPAMLKGSALWRRIQEGLKLYGVKGENLHAVTSFRLDMVQRPRFTTKLYDATPTTLGTYGCLLGDAANAIHFWPGRGLNSGLTAAISLARSLTYNWRGRPLRESDFTRHEALMSMLQYRHKSRAWRAMVTTDSDGTTSTIKGQIRAAILDEGNQATAEGATGKEFHVNLLVERMGAIRDRLSERLAGLPDDDTLQAHLMKVDEETLRTLVVSGEWDTFVMGGEEVDVNLFFQEPESLEDQPNLEKRIEPIHSVETMGDPTIAMMDSMITYVNQNSILPAFAYLVYAGEEDRESDLPYKLPIHRESTAIRIGRNVAWSNLVIPNNRVSRRHASLRVDGAQNLYITDMDSAGGTYINGGEIVAGEERQLQDNDMINFARAVTYRVERAAS